MYFILLSSRSPPCESRSYAEFSYSPQPLNAAALHLPRYVFDDVSHGPTGSLLGFSVISVISSSSARRPVLN